MDMHYSSLYIGTRAYDFWQIAPSEGDLLRYSTATVSVILDPDPDVNSADVLTTFVRLAVALTLYNLCLELVLVVKGGPELCQLGSG